MATTTATANEAATNDEVTWTSSEILDSIQLFLPLMEPLSKMSGTIALISTFFAALQAQMLTFVPDGNGLYHTLTLAFIYMSIFIHIFSALFGAFATSMFGMPPPRAEPELSPGTLPVGTSRLQDVEWDLCSPSFYLAIPVVGGFAFLFLAFVGVVAGISITIIGLEILVWIYQPLAVAVACTAVSALAVVLLTLSFLLSGIAYVMFEKDLHAERRQKMLNVTMLALQAVNKFQRRGGLKFGAGSAHVTALPGTGGTHDNPMNEDKTPH